MVDDNQLNIQDDEVLFSARYSPFKVWLSVIVLFAYPMSLLFRVSYSNLLTGRYINAFLISVLALIILLIAPDSILFKELIFYHDRLVKVWHFFGQTTIYYSRAMLIDQPWYLRWLSRAIRETRVDGKYLFIQRPVFYFVLFFPRDSAQVIGRILDYLTEDTERNQRPFRKAWLPKEVICR